MFYTKPVLFTIAVSALMIWPPVQKPVIEKWNDETEKILSSKTTGPVPGDFVVRSSTGKNDYRKGHTGIGLQYIICTAGTFPSAYATPGTPGPFISEIRILSAVQAGSIPAGWLPCDGQLVSITQYNTLFALIGTQYGGDGRYNFALPDLRGATAVGQGNGWTMAERSN